MGLFTEAGRRLDAVVTEFRVELGAITESTRRGTTAYRQLEAKENSLYKREETTVGAAIAGRDEQQRVLPGQQFPGSPLSPSKVSDADRQMASIARNARRERNEGLREVKQDYLATRRALEADIMRKKGGRFGKRMWKAVIYGETTPRGN